MSCDRAKSTNCPCDQHVHPRALDILPGLSSIPRQIASFADWRDAMLASLGTKVPLSAWRALEEADLGLMVLEMWAYILDSCSFYDETIAHESYLRTARQRPSLRKLAGLLGYRPRPAVGAQVRLAAFAEGPKPVDLPARTAFRSGAFDGEPPQVFELDADQTIHAENNAWEIRRPRRTTIADTMGLDITALQDATENVTKAIEVAKAAGATLSTSEIQEIRELWYQSFDIAETPKPLVTQRLLLVPGTVRLARGDVILVEFEFEGMEHVHVRTVTKTATVSGCDEQKYVSIILDNAIEFPVFLELSAIRVRKPTAKALFSSDLRFLLENPPGWPTLIHVPFQLVLTSTPEMAEITLDQVYPQIRPSHRIILEKDAVYRWFDVTRTAEVKRHTMEEAAPGAPFDKIPAVVGPVTRLTLGEPLNSPDDRIWSVEDLQSVSVLYDLVDAGEVTVEAQSHLSAANSLELIPPVQPVGDYAGLRRFLFQDAALEGIELFGTVQTDPTRISLDSEYYWDNDLKLPVNAFGNVLTASRGEKVVGEVLGSGDAATANQSFKLKKKPLTYLPSTAAGGTSAVSSTLSVYVDSVRWLEVLSFFHASPDDRVYTVQHDDEGETIITFGDGRHGARLPTGVDNILANYRYGAGQASPPAGSITQIASAVKGLASVSNPVPAGGGADAESREDLRRNVPASTLLLGRAVSIPDMEAVAAQVPGVRVARGEWRWSGTKQRPEAQIWFVGTADQKTVSLRLRSMVDPATPLAVVKAVADESKLVLVVKFSPAYLPEKVKNAIKDALLNPLNGLLLPESLGISGPIFRSRLSDWILEISGVDAVTSIKINGESFASYGKLPKAEHYFDFEEGGVVINPSSETRT